MWKIIAMALTQFQRVKFYRKIKNGVILAGCLFLWIIVVFVWDAEKYRTAAFLCILTTIASLFFGFRFFKESQGVRRRRKLKIQASTKRTERSKVRQEKIEHFRSSAVRAAKAASDNVVGIVGATRNTTRSGIAGIRRKLTFTSFNKAKDQ